MTSEKSGRNSPHEDSQTIEYIEYDEDGWPIAVWCDQCNEFHPVETRQALLDEQADRDDIEEQEQQYLRMTRAGLRQQMSGEDW